VARKRSEKLLGRDRDSDASIGVDPTGALRTRLGRPCDGFLRGFNRNGDAALWGKEHIAGRKYRERKRELIREFRSRVWKRKGEFWADFGG
jgi:hypothetical protein